MDAGIDYIKGDVMPDTEERRKDSDRITRVETVVERLEEDISTLTQVYREQGDKHTLMFIEMIKSSSALQSAIDKLNTILGPIVEKVEKHDQVIWKAVGFISALNVIAWVILHFIGH